MPSEPEEDSRQNRFLMDLDLDLDGSWPLDQIVGSPFFISSSEVHQQQQQPFSPLWAFPDDVSNGGFVAGGGGLRMLSYARSPDVGKDNAFQNDDKKHHIPSSSPFVGLMPIDNADGTCVIKERMAQALRYFKDSTEQHVLAQVWAPVKHGDRCMLTTSGQPFVLDPNSNGLHQYRMVSQIYMFSVDGDADGDLGLPGRVFRQKLPEWSPNVQYYSSKEFSRLNHALDYNVRGTLALPVFEPLGLTCVGVLELIMTSPLINYAPEVDKVCKALEAVNLKSSEILDHRSTQICNQGRQNALAEILEIITVVSETHTLPLAQTWVPCMHGSILANGGSFKKNCSSFDGSCRGRVCMSTTDVAFYVVDAHMWGFRDACAEHHLRKGQGVAGRAFASRGSCFCPNVTEFCKTQYPLVHYARMFRLRGSFAICLRSDFTGDDDYVLEFFLPTSVEGCREQRVLLDSILGTVKQHFGSLRVASGKDLDMEWRDVEIVSADEKDDLKPNYVISSPIGETVHLDASEGLKIKDEANANNVRENACNNADEVGKAASDVEVRDPGKKKSERKRGKAEKTISLDVLQQYFAGSLKDAAKSLGVCPTTMKRICRQHGISRWPSRKINKVNRSLSKLKRVIESVQGGEGSFSLTSLDANPIPGAVGSLSWAANLNGAIPQGSSGQKPLDFQEGKKDFDPIQATPLNEQAEDSQRLNNAILKGKGTERSRTQSGSREDSIETHASQGSCQGTPCNRNKTSPQNDRVASPTQKGGLGAHLCQEINLAAGFSFPDDFIATAPRDEGFGGMLLEDAGSSHDLRNLCPPNETLFDENIAAAKIDPCDRKRFPDKSGSKIVTIKAAYREDIIRFRLAIEAGIVGLREEVSKRLKLELGTFDVKYFDDDHEWVLIACDADLLECIDLSRSSGGNIVRLLVHEINANLGSSCESSGQ